MINPAINMRGITHQVSLAPPVNHTSTIFIAASIEIIDLRSLLPWDEQAVSESVRKTNRVIVLHEDTMTGGIGAEISSRIQEMCWKDLDAPVHRVAGLDTAFPFAENLERQFLANARIDESIASVLNA